MSKTESPFSFIYNSKSQMPDLTLNAFKTNLLHEFPDLQNVSDKQVLLNFKESLLNLNHVSDMQGLLKWVFKFSLQSKKLIEQDQMDNQALKQNILTDKQINTLRKHLDQGKSSYDAQLDAMDPEELLYLANLIRPVKFQAEDTRYNDNISKSIWHYVVAATTTVFLSDVECVAGDKLNDETKIKVFDEPLKCSVYFVTAKVTANNLSLGIINQNELSSNKSGIDQDLVNKYVSDLLTPSFSHADNQGVATLIIPDLGCGAFAGTKGIFKSEHFKIALKEFIQNSNFTNIKKIISTVYDPKGSDDQSSNIGTIEFETKNIYQDGLLSFIKAGEKTTVVIAGDSSAPAQDAFPLGNGDKGDAYTTDGMIGAGTTLFQKILEAIGINTEGRKYTYYSQSANTVISKSLPNLMPVLVNKAKHLNFKDGAFEDIQFKVKKFKIPDSQKVISEKILSTSFEDQYFNMFEEIAGPQKHANSKICARKIIENFGNVKSTDQFKAYKLLDHYQWSLVQNLAFNNDTQSDINKLSNILGDKNILASDKSNKLYQEYEDYNKKNLFEKIWDIILKIITLKFITKTFERNAEMSKLISAKISQEDQKKMHELKIDACKINIEKFSKNTDVKVLQNILRIISAEMLDPADKLDINTQDDQNKKNISEFFKKTVDNTGLVLDQDFLTELNESLSKLIEIKGGQSDAPSKKNSQISDDQQIDSQAQMHDKDTEMLKEFQHKCMGGVNTGDSTHNFD